MFIIFDMMQKIFFVSIEVTLCNNNLFYHFVFYLSKFASLYNLALYTDIFNAGSGWGRGSPAYLVFCYFIFR